MPPRKKDVCIKTKKGLVSFEARHTSSPCQQGQIIKKKMNAQELATHRSLGYHKRIPNLAGRKGRTAVMPYKGEALRDLGGRRTTGGKQIVLTHQQQLRKDLTKALSHLHNRGIKHKDLREGATRNILWDGKHFNVIDFGKVSHSSNYSVTHQVNKTLSYLLRWARS